MDSVQSFLDTITDPAAKALKIPEVEVHNLVLAGMSWLAHQTSEARSAKDIETLMEDVAEHSNKQARINENAVLEKILPFKITDPKLREIALDAIRELMLSEEANA